jgi:hypothetical protein
MSKKKMLKPAKEGAKIVNPENGFNLRDSGEMVELNKFWRRRLMSGEVVEVKPEKKKVIKKVEKKKITNEEKGE